MKFILTTKEAEFLEKYAKDAFDLFSVMSKAEQECIFSADYDQLIDELTFAVIGVGMDDEDTVNEIGKELYRITDKVVYQSKKTVPD